VVAYLGNRQQVGGRVDRRLFDQPQFVVCQHESLQAFDSLPCRAGVWGAASSASVEHDGVRPNEWTSTRPEHGGAPAETGRVEAP
jgi:hypothetical protein